MRPPIPLSLESAVLRSAGALSRVAGRGGGTTLPGKLLWKLDPGAIDRLASRLEQGSALVSATNGKTTSTAMVAAILGPRTRVAHNSSGANLVSGVASALLRADDAQLGLFEVDEAALPEVARRIHPRALLLGNLFRDQLDRYGELELVAARWRDTVAALPDAELVVNGDDPQVGDLARGRPRPGLRRRRSAPGAARPPACRRLEVLRALRNAVRLRRSLRRSSRQLPLPEVRPCAAGTRRRCARDRTARPRRCRVHARGSSRALRASSSRCPGLYNVYNALGAGSLALTLGASLDEVVAGLQGFSAAFGRFERITVGDRRLLMLLVKNPAGANEVVRTLVEGRSPTVAVVALNDEIADGRDVSWIWDVDFEPLLGSLDRLVATGSRAAELALRFAYGGLARERIEVVPALEAALDRGLELTPAGSELVVLPTYTAMLALRRIVAGRGHVANYWESAA